MSTKRAVLDKIVGAINQVKKASPLMVGIDGVDGAGKTLFAEALAHRLAHFDRPVVSSSVDHFHYPAKIRYQKGKDSPLGFYHDSYNYKLMKAVLLDPFLRGSGHYKTAVFDCTNDVAIDMPIDQVPSNGILVMEGIFLFRPELVDYWDMKIFLEVDFKTTLQRCIHRKVDQERLGAKEKIIEKYQKRYIPGQQLYFEDANPKAKADVWIDNTDFEEPVVKIIVR